MGERNLDTRILDKFGPRNNQLELELKQTMLVNNLQSTTPDFPHNKYHNFVGNGIAAGRQQIDFILASTDLSENIMDSKRSKLASSTIILQ